MIIGIAGKAGCGKDTVADYLVKYYGFKKDSLAAPIKRLVQDIFVLSDECMTNRTARELPLHMWPNWTVRRLLQYIGTELLRTNIEPDIWVKSLCLRAQRDRASLVVPDLRFPNELDFMRREFGERFLSIRIDRPGIEAPPSGIQGHASESFVLETDIVIVNDGTVWDLYNETTRALAERGIKSTPLDVEPPNTP